MLRPTLWLLASVGVVSCTTVPDIPLTKPEDFLAKRTTHGWFIVQLKSDASLDKVLGQRSPHEQFHKRAALGLDYKVRTEFTNDKLFYGVSIELAQKKTRDEVQSILDKIPEVQAVWPIRTVSKPSPAEGTGNFSSLASAKYDSLSGRWSPTDDTPSLPLIKGANVDSTHKMTGVDKLHANGIKGNRPHQTAAWHSFFHSQTIGHATVVSGVASTGTAALGWFYFCATTK